MELFVTGKADRVELLYHHFKNMATQVVTHKTYLPLSLSDTEAAETATDYILEPSAEELRNRLFPKLLNLTIYTILLDTSTAEHAARMMAMQTANDNANDLIQQLTLQYNKTRQVGAFAVRANADRMLEKLKAAGFTGFVVKGKK